MDFKKAASSVKCRIKFEICDALSGPRLTVHPGRGLPRSLTQDTGGCTRQRTLETRTWARGCEEHGDVKKPFLVHYPKAVSKSLLFNKKAATLSGPEVGTGTSPPSYRCCDSGLGLTPWQVWGSPSWHPTRQGPQLPKTENSKKLAQYTQMLISLLLLPQIIPKQYMLLAESNEFLFYWVFDQVAPVKLRRSKITEEAHPSSLSPFRDWTPHPLLLLGEGDGYFGQNKGIQLHIKETVLSQYCWVN